MENNLTGKILIATPKMDDTRFSHSIILICQHDEEHTIGLVLNRNIKDISICELFDNLDIGDAQTQVNGAILDGGPCQKECGFVIHSDDFLGPESNIIARGIAINASKSILKQIIDGNPPKKYVIALGYSGWGAGQLEQELAQNIWLITDSDCEIVFSQSHETKWQAMMDKIGVDPARLSIFGGNS